MFTVCFMCLPQVIDAMGQKLSSVLLTSISLWYTTVLGPVYCLVTKSCPTLCDSIDCTPPGSSVHIILQAIILEWVAISFSRGSSWPLLTQGQTWVSCIARQILYYWANWEALVGMWKVKVAQSCPTLCNPVDYIVYGILQGRILEWVDFPFSRGSSQPRDRTQVSCIADRFFTSWATREASIGM